MGCCAPGRSEFLLIQFAGYPTQWQQGYRKFLHPARKIESQHVVYKLDLIRRIFQKCHAALFLKGLINLLSLSQLKIIGVRLHRRHFSSKSVGHICQILISLGNEGKPADTMAKMVVSDCLSVQHEEPVSIVCGYIYVKWTVFSCLIKQSVYLRDYISNGAVLM